MPRWVCLLPALFLCVALAPLQAQDKEKQDKDKQVKEKDKKLGPVEITWHGQSFFRITSPQGTVIVTDPHQIPEYGRPLGIKADIVTMSHFHSDHIQLRAIENFDDKNLKQIRGLKGGGNRIDWNIVDEKIKDVNVRSVGVFHDSQEGLKFGKNAVFIFEIDGWKIVHLGDLGHSLSPAQIRQIGPIDVLMIPVGGIYTLNGDEARAVVKQLKPKEYIIPMHCGTKIYSDLLTPDEFLEGVEKKRLVVADDNKLLLTRDPKSNPEARWESPWTAGTTAPRPLIIQLHYWPKGGLNAEPKKDEKPEPKK
jgi:L-ascorbate metabolism protein UlaG (beta-lactamase superfamily)